MWWANTACSRLTSAGLFVMSRAHAAMCSPPCSAVVESADREDEGEGIERRLPGRAVAEPVEKLLLEGFHAAVDQVFLGREVVEDGCFGDVGFAGDLGDGDLVEPSRHEEPHGRLADQVARALLLALSEAGLPAHPETTLAPLLWWHEYYYNSNIRVTRSTQGVRPMASLTRFSRLLEGKVAIVTGASRGIGAAAARVRRRRRPCRGRGA